MRPFWRNSRHSRRISFPVFYLLRNRLLQRGGLMPGFLVFVFRNRVGNDLASNVVVNALSNHSHRANRDIQPQVSVEAHEADGTGIDVPLCALELVNDLNRADLRAARNGFAGESRAQDVHDRAARSLARQEQLGRRADDHVVPAIQKGSVKGRTHAAQTRKQLERRSLNLLGESLRQVHLVDIACSDVMERPLDGDDVLALVHIRLRQPGSSGASRRSRSRDTSLNFSQTLFQRSLGTPPSQRPLAGFVIENQQKVINSEAAIRQMQIVNGLEVLISLEESKQVIAEIADRSSGEPDCVSRLRSPGLRQPVERRNRIFMSPQPFTPSAYIDPGALGAEDNLRVPAKD